MMHSKKIRSTWCICKGLQKALNKEKELFTFLNQDGATQSEVDSKSKDLSKAYKDMNKNSIPTQKRWERLLKRNKT